MANLCRRPPHGRPPRRWQTRLRRHLRTGRRLLGTVRWFPCGKSSRATSGETERKRERERGAGRIPSRPSRATSPRQCDRSLETCKARDAMVSSPSDPKRAPQGFSPSSGPLTALRARGDDLLFADSSFRRFARASLPSPPIAAGRRPGKDFGHRLL